MNFIDWIKLSTKARAFSENFAEGALKSPLGHEAEEEGWKERLYDLARSVSEYYYFIKSNTFNNIPSDIYRSLPKIRDIIEIEEKLRFSQREAALNGNPVNFYIDERVKEYWKGLK